MITAQLIDKNIITENTDAARALYDQARLGTKLRNGRIQLSLTEAIYLVEDKKLNVVDARNRTISDDLLIRKATKQETDFLTRYAVFADLRDRGYIVKTALKFGADFRVYDRGIKPGQDHAKWVVFPVKETDKTKWSDFSGKNRIAHSTKKNLLIGVVDEENAVSYWEVSWVKP